MVWSEKGRGVVHFKQLTAVGGLSAWQIGHCIDKPIIALQ